MESLRRANQHRLPKLQPLTILKHEYRPALPCIFARANRVQPYSGNGYFGSSTFHHEIVAETTNDEALWAPCSLSVVSDSAPVPVVVVASQSTLHFVWSDIF